MTGPIKAAFCSVCCRRHFLDAGCDPTDKRYTANARNMALADAVEISAAWSNAKPREPYRPMSYAEETAWNDPWWT